MSEQDRYKTTKCQGCGTQKEALFMRPNARHAEDTWCKPCMTQGKHLDGGQPK